MPILISAILAMAGLMTLFIGQGLLEFSLMLRLLLVIELVLWSLLPYLNLSFFLVVNSAYIFVLIP